MEGIEEYFYLSALEMRACLNLYRKTGITNKQIQILYGFSAWMLLHDKKRVNLKKYCEWSGAGPAMNRIIKSQLSGLVDCGALHKIGYKMQPGKFGTFVITAFGVRILEAYEKELEALSNKYKGRDKKPGYKSLAIHSANLEEAFPMYYIGEKGRDD